MLSEIIIGLATAAIIAIGGLILKSIKKVLDTQQQQGKDIAGLKTGISTLLKVNEIQTENIQQSQPVIRNTIKSTRSICYSQKESLAGNIEAAKDSLSRAFELINCAEDAMNNLSDKNAATALAAGGR